MPWTFAHPAIILPIKQSRLGKYLNLPALVIGSVSPDLFYSFGLYGLATRAHHFIGWVYTGLPLSIIVYLIMIYLSVALMKILPVPLQTFQKWSVTGCLVVILSLFLGAATHILWDGFTHETGRFVRYFTFLQYPLFPYMTDKQEIHVYKVLQLLSSFFGVLYIFWKYQQYQRTLRNNEQKNNKQKILRLFGLGVISLILTMPISLSLSHWGNLFNQFVFYELSLSVSAFFIMIMVIMLLIHFQLIKY